MQSRSADWSNLKAFFTRRSGRRASTCSVQRSRPWLFFSVLIFPCIFFTFPASYHSTKAFDTFLPCINDRSQGIKNTMSCSVGNLWSGGLNRPICSGDGDGAIFSFFRLQSNTSQLVLSPHPPPSPPPPTPPPLSYQGLLSFDGLKTNVGQDTLYYSGYFPSCSVLKYIFFPHIVPVISKFYITDKNYHV